MNMILSTTPSIQGKEIKDYHGVVTGEAIIGADIIKDMFVSIRDIGGGRSAAYEQELQKSPDHSLRGNDSTGYQFRGKRYHGHLYF